MVLPHKKSIGQKVTTLLVFQAYIIVKIDPALHSTKVTECHIALYKKFQFGFTCLSGQLVYVTSGANIVFESGRRRAGLVFQNLAFSG